MSDDTENRGPEDRRKINLTEEWEVHYWTEALGVTREQLEEAVKSVGSGADRVKVHIQSKGQH